MVEKMELLWRCCQPREQTAEMHTGRWSKAFIWVLVWDSREELNGLAPLFCCLGPSITLQGASIWETRQYIAPLAPLGGLGSSSSQRNHDWKDIPLIQDPRPIYLDVESKPSVVPVWMHSCLNPVWKGILQQSKIIIWNIQRYLFQKEIKNLSGNMGRCYEQIVLFLKMKYKWPMNAWQDAQLPQ